MKSGVTRRPDIPSGQDLGTVVFTCSYVPCELVEAFGLGASFFPFEGTVAEESKGERRASESVCSWCKALLGAPETRPVVGCATCDQMKRALELRAARGGSPALIVTVPASRSEESRDYYESEVRWLAQQLEIMTGLRLDRNALTAAIQKRNAIRRVLKAARTRIKGSAFTALIHMEMRLNSDKMLSLLDSVESHEPPSDRAVRLMIAGSPLAPSDARFLEMVESLGGEIVADTTCTGDRRIDFEVEEAGDPLTAIARAYWNKPPCIRARPNDAFYEYSGRLAATRGVQGVIWRTVRLCDLWSAEEQRARRKLGLPLLGLDMNYADVDSSRVRTRVEAFLEGLR